VVCSVDAGHSRNSSNDRHRARTDRRLGVASHTLQNAGLDVQQRVNPELVKLAAEAKLPLVATGDVHYLRHEDARAHEALLCIQSGDSLKNEGRWKFDTDQFYFKTPAEMAADFADYPEALRHE
jgi:DNA polymerase-3 subunit alpha